MKSQSKFPYLARRTESFRDLLKEKKLDAYLLTHLSDLYYFTDYKSEGYYALIGLKDSWLFLPNLLFEQGKASTRGFICLEGKFFEELKKVIAANSMKKIGFDPGQL